MGRILGRNPLVIFAVLATALLAHAANPAPLLLAPLLPGAAKPGTPGLTLTVHGFGFVPASTVYLDGAARDTKYVNQSQLTVRFSASDLKHPHTASVTVVSPAPGGGTSNAVLFPVTTTTVVASFAPYSSVDTGADGTAVAVVTGDFNRDGNPDMAVAKQGSNTVAILLGNGDGTFQPFQNYPTGSNPVQMIAADFNGDGILDLATINSSFSSQSANSVSILLGNADGSFRPNTDYSTGTNPAGITSGDFNGDGSVDLAVVNSDGSLNIFLGNGAGTFAAPTSVALGIYPVKVTTADFNQDGKLDLAISGYNPNGGGTDPLYILMGNGDATFQAARIYDTFQISGPIAVADFAHHGTPDVVIDGTSFSNTNIFRNNGTGGFGHFIDFSTGYIGTDLAIGDFNGDGFVDLGYSTDLGGAAVIYLGAGIKSQGLYSFTTPEYTAVALADFNNDGHLDIVTVGNTSADILLSQPVVASPFNLAFPTTYVGSQSASQTVTLTNAWKSAIAINGIVVSGTNPGDFSQSNSCGNTLAAGASCTISVNFNPIQDGGSSAVLSIAHTGPYNLQTIPLTGTGNATLITPANVRFQSQKVGTTSGTVTVTVKNIGTTASNNYGVFIYGVNPGDFAQTNNCPIYPATLPPQQSCMISTTFTPTRLGHRYATLQVGVDGGVYPLYVYLNGIGN